MRDNREIVLPIFSFETIVQYNCPDGFIASNLQEAKEHGYGTGRCRSVGFDHGTAYETFDYSVLPVLSNYSMVLEKPSWGGYLLRVVRSGLGIL